MKRQGGLLIVVFGDVFIDIFVVDIVQIFVVEFDVAIYLQIVFGVIAVFFDLFEADGLFILLDIVCFRFQDWCVVVLYLAFGGFARQASPAGFYFNLAREFRFAGWTDDRFLIQIVKARAAAHANTF